jgi:hypothetical protein
VPDAVPAAPAQPPSTDRDDHTDDDKPTSDFGRPTSGSGGPLAVGRPDRPRLRRWLIRLLGGTLGLGLLLAVAASLPSTALASGSCTGWTSTIVPPDTIKVLRRDGKVVTVNFKRYVRKVMASGEWPYTLPRALLRAGAQATKQFAWYHSLKGNHRRGFVTADGECFDVVATTQDQLYKSGATVHRKQRRATNAIWDLSLHRNDRFILTQYRRGQRVPCASDVDGRRLFARSAKRCARAGWSGKRILRTYYSTSNTVALVSGPIGYAVAYDHGLSVMGLVEPWEPEDFGLTPRYAYTRVMF